MDNATYSPKTDQVKRIFEFCEIGDNSAFIQLKSRLCNA